MFLIGALLPSPVTCYLASRSWYSGILVLAVLDFVIAVTPDLESRTIGAGMVSAATIAWLAGMIWRSRQRVRGSARSSRFGLPTARVVKR